MSDEGREALEQAAKVLEPWPELYQNAPEVLRRLAAERAGEENDG